MPKIVLRKKTIDPKTGSDVIENKTFFIDENHPYNSIYYHRVADTFGVDRYERANHDIARKITHLFNYAMNKTKSVDRALNEIRNLRRSNLNLGWLDVLNFAYRDVRLKEDSAIPAESPSLDPVSTENRSRAEELRKSGDTSTRIYEDSIKEFNKNTSGLMSERLKEVSYKDNISVKIIPHKESKEDV